MSIQIILTCERKLAESWWVAFEEGGFEVRRGVLPAFPLAGKILCARGAVGICPKIVGPDAPLGTKDLLIIETLASGGEVREPSAALASVAVRILISAGAGLASPATITGVGLLGCNRQLAQRWWVPVENAGMQVKLRPESSGLTPGEVVCSRVSVGVWPLPLRRGVLGGPLNNECAIYFTVRGWRRGIRVRSLSLLERVARILIEAGAEVELPPP